MTLFAALTRFATVGSCLGIAVLAACGPSKTPATQATSPVLATSTDSNSTVSTHAIAGATAATDAVTLAPIPTLSTEAAAAKIEQLLRNDTDCPGSSACFWGIIPGQTDLTLARNLLGSLRLSLVQDQVSPPSEFYSTSFRSKAGLGAVILLDAPSTQVQNISLRADLVNSRGTKTMTDWPAYSLDQLLAKHGVPSAVQFRLDYPHEPGYPAGTAWYDMIVSFGPQGVTVEYDHGLIQEANRIWTCPLTTSLSSIGIWMGQNPSNLPGGGKSLQEVAGIDLRDFHDLFVGGSRSTCFNMELSAFNTSP